MQTVVVSGSDIDCALYANDDYTNARDRHFPNAGDERDKMGHYGRERGRIYVCTLCVRASKEFAKRE